VPPNVKELPDEVLPVVKVPVVPPRVPDLVSPERSANAPGTVRNISHSMNDPTPSATIHRVMRDLRD
jgi:hypothetical protein